MNLFKIWASTIVLITTVLASQTIAQTVLKAGHISPDSSLEGIAINRFADLVSGKTNGSLVVEVFPSEQLGKAVTQIDSTIIGNQDIYFGGNPEFERFSDGLKLLGLNWVIPSQSGFRRVTQDPIWSEVFLDPMEDAGLSVLASNWERGPYRVMISKNPINSIADMEGVKFRIAPIETWRKSWGAVGMKTVVLAWTDVYLGLKQGTVEAVTAPISLVRSMKFTEVAKHITRTDEFWQILVPIINSKKYNSLSQVERDAIAEAAREAGDWFVAEQERRGDEDIEAMKLENNATFRTIDLAPGVEIMKDVIADMEDEGLIPGGLFERILEVATGS